MPVTLSVAWDQPSGRSTSPVVVVVEVAMGSNLAKTQR